jgi:hypothetical protein
MKDMYIITVDRNQSLFQRYLEKLTKSKGRESKCLEHFDLTANGHPIDPGRVNWPQAHVSNWHL